jgi:predicted O-methyltransferase YrrM
VAWLLPARALELGTQLGISALYQAYALRDKASLTTVEGSAEVAAIAHENWAQCPMTPAINSVVSPFDAFLGHAHEPWDYVLLDGHHDEAATLRYFEMLLPQLTEGACVVLDDIRWSRGMHRAWQRVQEHPEVSVSVDLFRMGLAFVRRPQAKEHFCLWPGFRIFMGR